MADPQKRAGRLYAMMGLSGRTLLLLAIIVFGIAAAYRLDWRSDWSYFGRFTLHPELARIIGELDEPVQITAISPKHEDAPYWLDQHERIGKALQAMAASSERLSFQSIDIDLDKPELQAFEKAHGQALPRSIYLNRGEKLFRLPLGQELNVTLQRDIGGALVSLATQDRIPVYFLLGHGELNPQGRGPDGCSALWQAAELAGFAPRLLRAQEVSRLGRLPDDGVICINGPTAPLGEALIVQILSYLTDGGSLLLLADDRCPLDLAQLLNRRGVVIGVGRPKEFAEHPEYVFDKDAEAGDALTIHSATESLVGQDQRFDRLLLGPNMIQPDGITERVLGQQRYLLSPRSCFMFTAASPWLSQPMGRDRDRIYASHGTPPFKRLDRLVAIESGKAWLTLSGDWQSPVERPQSGALYPILVAIANKPHSKSVRPDRGARLLIWNSREAGSDAILRQGIYANEDLLVDGISWLARRSASTTIPPANYAPIKVDATDGQMHIAFIMLVIVFPMLCLGGAMIAWWERR